MIRSKKFIDRSTRIGNRIVHWVGIEGVPFEVTYHRLIVHDEIEILDRFYTRDHAQAKARYNKLVDRAAHDAMVEALGL